MQEVLCVTGGRRLEGRVQVSGAKNAALPLLIASLLTEEECVFENVPNLEDISVLLRLLRSLGAEFEFHANRVRLRTPKIRCTEAPYGLVKALRASFWVLGPLLARFGEARVSLPGGDAIGTRPVDIHLEGLSKMGAEVRLDHGVVYATAPGGLRPADITLDFPSVGATHQLLMAAALTSGRTVIRGAAREPEIVDVAKFLSSLGAKIEGAGTAEIEISGCRELGFGSHQVVHRVMGDRIEAATYLAAAAATGGKVCVEGIAGEDMASVLELFEATGSTVLSSCGLVEADEEKEAVSQVVVSGPAKLEPVSFETAPFPGVATDVQPMLMAMLTRANGKSVIRETVFENRFGHVAEYRRFGADITIDGRVATICGVPSLTSAPVEAGDIRAAAGLAIIALLAEGTTIISEIYHLDRGYDGLVSKLDSLGAKVSRIPALESRELVFGC